MKKKDNALNEFLWSLTGFKKDIISNRKVDSHYALIIGTLLLIVGIYASFAWTFFFQTVSSTPLIPAAAGLFMGFYIISFDRALIASMSTGNSNIFSIGFRLILAVLLGVFLAQPMILKFYQNDIKREAQILVDKKNQERKKIFENIYANNLKELKTQKIELINQINNKRGILNNAETDFKQEMDGTGGTRARGYNIVSKRKERILILHQNEFNALSRDLQPKIDKIQKNIDKINDKVASDFETYKNDNTVYGTLVQVEALNSLIKKDKSGSLSLRYYLLSIILSLIELSALIAKLLFKTKSYNSKINFIIEEEVQHSENDKEISLGKLEEYKNRALESELELIKRFFKESKVLNNKKLDELMKKWRNKTDGTYKELYELFKTNFSIHN